MNFWTIFWCLGILVGIGECELSLILVYTFLLLINIGNIVKKKEQSKNKKSTTSKTVDKTSLTKVKSIPSTKNVKVRTTVKTIPKNKIYKLNILPSKTEKIRSDVKKAPRDNSLILGRLLWDSYYKIAYDSMIKLSNTKQVTGIYKITNSENGKIYIGQAVNIAERWRQHIKAGIGAEFPSGNQMYVDMLNQGPETFTFEVQEKCNKEALNTREKYWISYYNSYKEGYNKTQGNKG